MLRRVILVVVSVFILTFLISYMSRTNAPRSYGLPEADVTVGAVRFDAEIVETLETQAQGLSGRISLEKDHGMIFIFPDEDTRTFWMKGMRFPLDLVWIRAGVVVGFTQNAPADDGLLRYSSPEPVNMVLEINAGEVARYGIKKGDRVTIERND